MATTASKKQCIELAKTLPPQLLRLFARWPAKEIRPMGYQSPFAELIKNPFAPTKNPQTGRLRDPVYSLRRQADLVKMARQHGVEELLPFSTKKTEVRLAKRVKYGLRVKGTGVGQKVKGHAHERGLLEKMEKRRKAMLRMPELIRKWKATGRRRWKQWPK